MIQIHTSEGRALLSKSVAESMNMQKSTLDDPAMMNSFASSQNNSQKKGSSVFNDYHMSATGYQSHFPKIHLLPINMALNSKNKRAFQNRGSMTEQSMLRDIATANASRRLSSALLRYRDENNNATERVITAGDELQSQVQLASQFCATISEADRNS